VECFLRRKNSATRRRMAARKRAPRAMPTLAPVERPPEEWEGEDVEETATGEDDEIGVVLVTVVSISVIVEPPLVMVVRPEIEAWAVVADITVVLSSAAVCSLISIVLVTS
jgi:hypothetical protein